MHIGRIPCQLVFPSMYASFKFENAFETFQCLQIFHSSGCLLYLYRFALALFAIACACFYRHFHALGYSISYVHLDPDPSCQLKILAIEYWPFHVSFHPILPRYLRFRFDVRSISPRAELTFVFSFHSSPRVSCTGSLRIPLSISKYSQKSCEKALGWCGNCAFLLNLS